jgi:hypothetical protein
MLDTNRKEALPLSGGASPALCEVTVLRVAERGAVACKTISPTHTVAYKAGMWQSVERKPVSGIEELSALLSALEGDKDAFIVRGQLKADHNGAELVQRFKADGRPEYEALRSRALSRDVYENFTLRRAEYLEPTARRWMLVDIDKLDVPEGMSPIGEDAVEYAVSLLGAEFSGVSHHFQFSSSARADNPQIKLHFWFWLDRPVSNEELRRWSKGHKGLVDSALYTSVQPHFTATPIFKKMADPLANQRSGLVVKAAGAVALEVPPEPVVEPAPVRSASPGGGDAERWLGRIGDPEYGIYDPVRQATWEYSRDHGRDGSDAFLERVYEAIRAAPGERSASQIERHCRDAKRLMDGALAKPAARRGAVAMASGPVTVQLSAMAGRAQLQEHLESFWANPRDMAIRVTAGTGKTSMTAALIGAQIQPGQIVHWFVPTLRLGEETAVLLRNANPTLSVRVVEGRNEDNCVFIEKTKAAGAAGLPVEKTCCDSRSNEEDEETPLKKVFVCPVKSAGQCVYYQQFETRAQIYIFAHQHIVLPKRRQLPAADVIVVDEDFHSHLVRTRRIDLGDLALDQSLSEISFALTGDKPLLKYLRMVGVTAETLVRRAAILRKDWQDQWINLDFSNTDFNKIGRLSPVYHLLRELADELSLIAADGITPQRGVSHRVRRRGGFVFVARRNEHRLTAPTLILDATADRRILGLIKPGIEFHEIDVKRNARVVQITDHRMSKSALTGRDSADLSVRVQAAIERLAQQYASGLLVTYKKFREMLTVPDGWSVEHFGNLRGIDGYKHYPVIVVIGANTPPIASCELTAGALIGNNDITLKLTNGETTEELRRYLGQEVGVLVRVHPDPFVQALVEQSREGEGVQAVDRLRLVGRATAGDVFIISSVPLPGLEVTELTTLKNLIAGGSMEERLLDRFGGLLPLGAKWLASQAPEMFTSESAAKHWVEDLRSELPSGTYRVKGQRGASPTRYISRRALADPRATLERLVGTLSAFTPSEVNEPPTAIISYIAQGGSFPWANRQEMPGFIAHAIRSAEERRRHRVLAVASRFAPNGPQYRCAA